MMLLSSLMFYNLVDTIVLNIKNTLENANYPQGIGLRSFVYRQDGFELSYL